MSADRISNLPGSRPSEAERRAHDVFCGEVRVAFVELAQHYRFDVTSTDLMDRPSDMVGHQVAGIVGFAGPGFGGSLAIRAPSTVVRQCLPISVGNPGVHLLGDWIGELANQLLGRTKNKLIRFGTTLQITPPTYAVADALIVLGCDPARTAWIAVETNAGPLLVMVELHAADDFAFHECEPPGVVAHAEGELLLF